MSDNGSGAWMGDLPRLIARKFDTGAIDGAVLHATRQQLQRGQIDSQSGQDDSDQQEK